MKTIRSELLLAGMTCLLLVMTVLTGNETTAQQKNPEPIKIPEGFYPLLPWDFIVPGDSLTYIADCNFTMAGFVRPYDIKRVEKLGLKAIINIYFSVGGKYQPEWEWRNLSDEEIVRKVKMMIDSTGNSDAVIGYYLMDEPSALSFPALGKAVAAVKKYAPGKLAYINLFPSDEYKGNGTLETDPRYSQCGTNTYAEYLERFVNEVKPQFISYDNYMVQNSLDFKDKTNVRYYTNLLEIRRIALKYELPYWNIVPSRQVYPANTIPSFPSLLFHAYTSLAAGYDGISWWKYKGRITNYSPIDNEQNKSVTWYYLKEVNRQILTLGPLMNQLTSTGVFFTSLVSDVTFPGLPGKIVESLKSDEPMMVGEFISGTGTRYVMIVNLSLERSVKFTFSTKTATEKISIISATYDHSLKPRIIAMDMDGHKNGLWLTAGEGVLIKVGD